MAPQKQGGRQIIRNKNYYYYREKLGSINVFIAQIINVKKNTFLTKIKYIIK